MYHIYENFISKVLPELVEWPGKKMLFAEFSDENGKNRTEDNLNNLAQSDVWSMMSDYEKGAKIQIQMCFSINPSIQKRETFIRNSFELDKVLTKVFPDEDVNQLMKDYYPFVVGFYIALRTHSEVRKIEPFSKVLNPSKKNDGRFYFYPNVYDSSKSTNLSPKGFLKCLVYTSIIQDPLGNLNPLLVDKLYQDFILDGGDSSNLHFQKLVFSNFVNNPSKDGLLNRIYPAWESLYINSKGSVRNSLTDGFFFPRVDTDDNVNTFKQYYAKLKNMSVEDVSKMDWALFNDSWDTLLKKQIISQLQPSVILEATKPTLRSGVGNNLLNAFLSLYNGQSIQPILDFKTSLDLKSSLSRSDLKSVISKESLIDSPENREIILKTFSDLNMANKENTFKSLDLLRSPLWLVESLVKSCQGGEMTLGCEFLNKQIKKIMNSNGDWAKENIERLENKLFELVQNVPEYVVPEFNVRVITYSLACDRMNNALFQQVKEGHLPFLKEVINAYVENKKEWKSSRSAYNSDKKTHDGSFEFLMENQPPVKIASAHQLTSVSEEYLDTFMLKIHLDKVIQNNAASESLSQENNSFKL